MSGRELRQPGVAIEALASAHAASCATPEATEIAGRQRTRKSLLNLSQRHHLAVTNDLAVTRGFPVARFVLSEIWNARRS